ncbi:MAG TPA: hypothetical protein VD905_10415, partial [Flavobacteriales bacterium]|nr:hypothetical protein [Flavobacteriales bacterium]
MRIAFAIISILMVTAGLAQKSELLLQKGHSKKINTLVFEPKGNFFATGSDDNLVILTDVQTGTAFKTLTGHTAGVKKILFTPDGKKLVTASKQEIIVWDLETEKKIFLWNEEGIDEYRPVGALSQQGTQFVFIGDDNRDYSMDLVTGIVTKPEMPDVSNVHAYEFTADSKWLLVIAEEKVVVLDGKTFAQKFIFGTQQLPKCYFITRDSKYYYCANASCNWQKWDLATGKMTESRRGRKDKVDELNDEGFIVVNNEHTVIAVYEKPNYGNDLLSFYDLWSGTLLNNASYKNEDLSGDKNRKVTFTSAAMNFSGTVFIAATTTEFDSRTSIQRMRYIDTRSGRSIRETKGFTSSVKTVSVAPDDRRLAILPWEDEQETRVWEMDKAGGRLMPLDESTKRTHKLFWSPDSKVLVAGNSITDLGTRDFHGLTMHFAYKSDEYQYEGWSISPDFKKMAGRERVLNYVTGAPQCLIDVTKDYTSTVFTDDQNRGDLGIEKTFAPDNKTLYTIKPDGENMHVSIYNVEQCTKTGIFTIETGVGDYRDIELHDMYTVSKSGKYMVFGAHEVHVFDLQKQEKVIDIKYKNDKTEHYGFPRTVNNVAMNAKENLLAVAYTDTTVAVFEFPSGKKIQTLRGHDLAPTSVTFKSNSDILISAGPDSKIIFWNPFTGEQLG